MDAFHAYPIWILTIAEVPKRKGCSGSGFMMRTRTGTRCVTFTQLPVAFCGGNNENAFPEPPLMLSTMPLKGCLGYMSTITSTQPEMGAATLV
jgi:hypothetical protein